MLQGGRLFARMICQLCYESTPSLILSHTRSGATNLTCHRCKLSTTAATHPSSPPGTAGRRFETPEERKRKAKQQPGGGKTNAVGVLSESKIQRGQSTHPPPFPPDNHHRGRQSGRRRRPEKVGIRSPNTFSTVARLSRMVRHSSVWLVRASAGGLRHRRRSAFLHRLTRRKRSISTHTRLRIRIHTGPPFPSTGFVSRGTRTRSQKTTTATEESRFFVFEKQGGDEISLEKQVSFFRRAGSKQGSAVLPAAARETRR